MTGTMRCCMQKDFQTEVSRTENRLKRLHYIFRFQMWLQEATQEEPETEKGTNVLLLMQLPQFVCHRIVSER